jgi:hypothetical protein
MPWNFSGISACGGATTFLGWMEATVVEIFTGPSTPIERVAHVEVLHYRLPVLGPRWPLRFM